MRNSTRAAAALLGAIVLTGVTAVSATAAPTDDTLLTVAVSDGTLDISGPAVDPEAVEAAPGGVAEIVLSGITVADNRATTGEWTASVSASNFTATIPVETGTPTVLNGVFTYVTGPATVSEAGPTVVASDVTGANEASAVQTATGVNGNNTATWGATVSLAIPAQALASESYTATLVHSVL